MQNDKNFVVYKSSAGSGKTFTLVLEYLKLVLNNPKLYKNILAITFTNKAANEMKERIIQYLKDLSSETYNNDNKTVKNFLPVLIKDTNWEEEFTRKQSQEVLNLILHDYSDFAISTIDSFFHRVVRSFAFDLYIPINFDVELDANTIIKQGIDLLIDRAGTDEKLTNILVSFIQSRAEDEKSRQIEKDILKIGKTLVDEKSLLAIDKIKELDSEDFINISKKLYKYQSEFEKEITSFAKEAYELIVRNEISETAFYYKGKGIGKYFEKITKSNSKCDLNPNSYVITTIADDKWTSKDIKSSELAALDTIKSQLTDLYIKIQNKLETDKAKYKIFSEINKNIYPLAVLKKLEEILEEMKHNNNFIFISDFNKKIAEVVMHEAVPFVYERIGERYGHYLIDEFQDTSILQWQNIIPLVENSLSEGNFNMIVGDGKQAIYRWRGGEVEQFNQLPNIYNPNDNEILAEREYSLQLNYEEKNLDSNYRSKAEIIDFNNRFFREISKNLTIEFQKIYNNLEQKFNATNIGGYVHVQFLDSEDIVDDPDSEEEKTIKDVYLENIEGIIRQNELDNFRWKDIAIICRTNNQASEVASYLMKQNINVVSSESLLLSFSSDVNFIMSTVKHLSNTKDNVAIMEMLNYLIKTKRIKYVDIESAVLDITKPLTLLFEDAESKINLLNSEQFASFIVSNGFNLKISELTKKPIYELCEAIINIFDIETDAYITFLLDFVLNFSGENNSNISDFVNLWEEKRKTLSVIVPEEINAVKIMSIHKSKGLEFPVVIYPFAKSEKGYKETTDWIDLAYDEIPELKTTLIALTKRLEETDYAPIFSLEKDKTLLDTINMLYVVMTRASQRLYVLSENTEKVDISIESMLKTFMLSVNDGENLKQYTFGSATANKNKSEEKNFDKINLFRTSDWKDKLLLKVKASEVWNTDNFEKSTEWGNLMHDILSKIVTEDDTNRVIENYVFGGDINTEEKLVITEKISNLINNPYIKPYFKKDLVIKNETEILLNNGMSYRPDRLIFDTNGITIIDYKTGQNNPKYEKQLNSYAEALIEMGYNINEKLLIFVEENKVVKL